MWYTEDTCSPRINGVAAMAGVDVNQPRAKVNTTAIHLNSSAARQNTGAWPAAGSG